MAKIGFQNNRNTYKLWDLLDDWEKLAMFNMFPKLKPPKQEVTVFDNLESLEEIATIMAERKAVNI